MKKQPFNLESFLVTGNGGGTIQYFKKNAVIFAQGDPSDGVFYVQEGQCKVTVVSEQGKEAVVAIHNEGSFFGEGGLNGQTVRLATVTAMTPCNLLRFENDDIKRLLREQPTFSEFFITYLLTRNTRIEADLIDQLFNSSEKRLARLLLIMANFGKEGKPETVITKVSQETLAEMIGTTRSRVNVFMNKFRKLGFIDYNGELTVHNSLLNVILHDDPRISDQE
jgi:CRP-like cAMP-binding protein